VSALEHFLRTHCLNQTLMHCTKFEERERAMHVSWSGVDKNNTIQVALVGMQSML
jgi:hypothetical protein